MKSPNIRILAIDDSPISRKRKKCDCIGVLTNGEVVEGIIHYKVTRDGEDATEKTIRAIKGSKFGKLIRLVMIHSVTLAGLNILDIKKLNEKLGAPIICITREKPHELQLRKAIEKVFKDEKSTQRKLLYLERAGGILEFKNSYFQIMGISEKEAEAVLNGFEGYPWNLRLAHLISTALVRGESHGKA